MMSVREFIQSTAGKAFAIVFTVVAIVAVVISVRSYIRGDTPDGANTTMYICAETGKSFPHDNVIGEDVPVMSPYSGKNTGYRAEACRWTASGSPKDDPTWVLVNETIGKPGPTFCPDCGRLVVGHNPQPGPNIKPPPTKTEYAARSASNATARRGQ